MKKISTALLMATTLSLSAVTFADSTTSTSNFYAGGNLGFSQMELPLENTTNWDTAGLGYNAHAGFMFNQYIGAELGYTRYATSKLGATIEGISIGQTYKAYSLDMAAKGVYTFNNSKVSVFGKLGLASLHAAYSDLSVDGMSVGVGHEQTKVVPLFGAGLGYNATQHLTVNTGVSYVNGGTTEENADGILNGLGNMTLVYAGVDYHF